MDKTNKKKYNKVKAMFSVYVHKHMGMSRRRNRNPYYHTKSAWEEFMLLDYTSTSILDWNSLPNPSGTM